MTHALQLPDEVYAQLEAYAASRGVTAQDVVAAWVNQTHGSSAPAELPYGYDPANDPLAEFLGTGELKDPLAIQRHDEAFADTDAEHGAE